MLSAHVCCWELQPLREVVRERVCASMLSAHVLLEADRMCAAGVTA
jgi:hypothetical protein